MSAADAAPAAQLPRTQVWISLDPGAHVLSGKSTILLPRNRVYWIRVKNLRITRILLGGKPIRPEIENGRLRILTVGKTERVEISFRAVFPPGEETSRGGYLGAREGLLFGNWFPAPEGLSYYTLSVTVPASLKVITSAEKLTVKTRKRRKVYTFVLNHPTPPPPLIYGPYEYYYRKHGRLIVALYLRHPDPDLAQAYLKKTLQYLDQYEQLLGPLPYRRLSIVEINREVGEAYPTLIFFGEKVIRLPFILDTSLPHEILHQWFGCGVYPRKANWSEGLVTYLADWKQAEKRGRGLSYRKDLLISHETWCQGKDPFPLSLFVARTDRCSQAVGYGKGAYFFYMLRQKVGDRVFYEALRDFLSRYLYQEADWEDLKQVFSEHYRRDLSAFFQQWVERTGEPSLHLSKRYLLKENHTYRLGLTLYQDPPYYHLRVPLWIKGGEERKLEVELSGPRKDLEVTLKAPPEEVLLDPEYRLWRKLDADELPPNLGLILASRGKVWVRRMDWPVYRPLIHLLRRRGYRVVWDKLPPGGPGPENWVFLGEIPPDLTFLFHGKGFPRGVYLEVARHPYRNKGAFLFFRATDAGEIRRILPRLEYYWRYQSLYFREGRLLEKIRLPGENGIRLLLSTEVTGLPLKDLLPLKEILRRISLYRVILIGEEHDRYEHHLTELEVIKSLTALGHRVAVGMEMFQRPFQKYLDLFVAGELTEKELLEKTEYFKRWNMDWKLYRPILLYARKKGLPVLALNAPSELVKKVSRSGLEGLSVEEKASLPEMDLNNPSYRAFLYRIYREHRDFAVRFPKFDYFYEAQILWDETMADTAARWLREHPDYQLVLLAGKGHIMYGFGIPSRLKRRGITSLVTLVLGGNERITSGFADYILYPEPAREPFSARLGVWLEETKEGLKVARVSPGSPAQKAGLKKGDLLLEADGERLKDVATLKIILTFKKKGDTMKLTYRRGEKTLEAEVKFE